MKILLLPSWLDLSDDYESGSFIIEQAKALRKTGHEVIIFFPSFSYKKFLYSSGMMTIENIPVYYHHKWSVPLKGTFFHSLYVNGIYTAWKKFKLSSGFFPDIIHAHGFHACHGLQRVMAQEKIPLVYTEHYSGLLNDNLQQRHINRIKESIAISDTVIAVSSPLRNKMAQLTSKLIHIIPNTIDTRRYCKMTRRKTSPFRWISIGSLDDRKRMALIIEAINQLKVQSHQLHLTIVGEGPRMIDLSNLVSKYELENEVNLVGKVPNRKLPAYLEQSHALISASQNETFGVTLIEALSTGMPVVTTPSQGPLEFMTPKHGLYLSGDSLKHIVHGMELVMDNYDSFDQEWISNDIQSRFNHREVGRQLSELYQSLL